MLVYTITKLRCTFIFSNVLISLNILSARVEYIILQFTSIFQPEMGLGIDWPVRMDYRNGLSLKVEDVGVWDWERGLRVRGGRGS